ncbi:MAG TPA: helix-turn-helix transcriptional regulator [Anaerolineae bacterium]|nr:helix-turn-helix transcriptional regulator [Anaerolineae bacterium]
MSPKGKYYPLFEYLHQQPDSVPLELSFAEIEAILGQPLPATALTIRAWWANSQTAQGRAWQDAGWLVDYPDFREKVVIFRPARITYRVTPIRKFQGWTGEQIKTLREFTGWSQQELADRLQVRQQTISDWEVGHHTARRSMSKLLQMVAEEVGFPYRTEASED